MPEKGSSPVEVRELGELPYEDALELQAELVAQRRAGDIPDQLILLEHPHVITLGSSAQTNHVLLSEEERARKGIQLFEAGRGGDVTYHGPGQLVGYPILSLVPDRKDLHRYLRDLEEVLVLTLKEFGIPGTRSEGFTGVWVPEGKVGAIGVRVSSGWITSHGFALNVRPDLSFFSAIVPCGIQDKPVTSMEEVLGRNISIQEVTPALIQSFQRVFSRTCVVA